MPNIKISVADKIATNMSPGVLIVCGNSDYTATFTFDSEWSSMTTRTARFLFYKQGRSWFSDVTFTGNTAKVPVLSGVDFVLVGVYAGQLHTTTPARILCSRSILCDDATELAAGPTRDSLERLIAEMEQRLASGDFEGPPGPQGPQGERGADGTGVTILGSYETEEALKAAHPTGTAGDSYLVGGNLYVWSPTSKQWENVGNIQGPQGPQGERGETGPAGERGADGTGVTILGSYETEEALKAAHPAGEIGDAYLVSGFLYVWSATTGNWENVGNIQGPQGEKGERGETGPAGERGADGTGVTILGSYETEEALNAAHPTGEIGDAYLVGGCLFVWSATSRTWENVGSIQGPAGPAGERGETGPAGPQGIQGERGEVGPAGIQGIQGERGETGPAGPAGERGKTGPQGPQGERGETGPAGERGETGPAGPAGERGETGPAGPQGIQGERGEVGPAGPQGIQGIQGERGETGPAGRTPVKGEDYFTDDDKTEIVNYVRNAMPEYIPAILDESFYGETLPPAGSPGRIFFLKVVE